MIRRFVFFLMVVAILSANASTAGAQLYFNINTSKKTEVKPEKPLVMRGLSIGMDINEARKLMVEIMGKEWKITPVGERKKILADYRFGEAEVFGRFQDGYFIDSKVGDYGFAIADKYDSYRGFISCDEAMKTVTQITFSEKITNQFFSISSVDVHVFVEALCNNYNMPPFYWIMHGWTHASPHGYALRIMTNKLIDIKKMEIQDSHGGQSSPSGIKFD